MNWSNLPIDVVVQILKLRTTSIQKERAAAKVQTRWRTYRTYVLVARFKMLRHLWTFRLFNPGVDEFLNRARL